MKQFLLGCLLSAALVLSWASGSDVLAAEGQRLFDEAELFSSKEAGELEAAIDGFREETGMDAAVVSAYNDWEKTAEEYADDFYDQNGFGAGKEATGVLLLFYMDGPEETGGEFCISTSGDMIRILTDDRLYQIEDDIADHLGNRDFSGASAVFLEDVAGYVDKGIQSGQYNYDRDTGKISVYKSIRWYEAAVGFAVSFVAAAGVCLGVNRSYRMEETGRQRENSLLAYRAGAAFRFRASEDKMVNKFVTSVRIPKPTAHSSSGRSGGRSSSGRSTTHRSSSGRSHGGGGRRF